jgi:Histidine kinase-, DNA gyrase B-, and HSP90-like ATPase
VQGQQGLDRSTGGLGIGLTLVRRLVEMHGGRVAARSDGPGRGSEFTVRLPLAPAAVPARHPTAAVPGGGDVAAAGPLSSRLGRDRAGGLAGGTAVVQEMSANHEALRG